MCDYTTESVISIKQGLTPPALILLFVMAGNALAAANDWAEGNQARSDGASRDFYNRAGLLAWEHFMGDWRDAGNRPQGNRPYAQATVIDDDREKPITWEVTKLVNEWLAGTYPNQGFFLKVVGSGGKIFFHSREREDRKPRLILASGNGKKHLMPVADTFLDTSTYRSLGDADHLRVSRDTCRTLLRFDLSGTERVDKAVLELYSTRQYGTTTIGVFRCAQGHDAPATDPRPGLAAGYSDDIGINHHPDVIFATGFESDHWAKKWTYAGVMDKITTTQTDPARKFEPLHGKALRVRISKGSNSALNTLFKFARQTGKEPEEIYFRYYLRLADDWNQTLEGGKMPGISGTYGKAGWGGRKSHGTDGWSARGAFYRSIPPNNPLGGLHPIGTYCYHADMKGQYGNSWIWQEGYRGFLKKNRWYAVEQYLKLNTPGKKDGVLRAWINGRPAFEKKDIRFRLVDKLKIEQIWMNVYHGGKRPSPYDQHLYIDRVVIAKSYVGP